MIKSSTAEITLVIARRDRVYQSIRLGHSVAGCDRAGVLPEQSGDAGEAVQRRAQAIGAIDDYPYLAEIARKLPETGYDNAVEFTWGLDLILDGLEHRRLTARR